MVRVSGVLLTSPLVLSEEKDSFHLWFRNSIRPGKKFMSSIWIARVDLTEEVSAW